MAGELGFEPRLAESESAVLPLDDSPMSTTLYCRDSHAAISFVVDISLICVLFQRSRPF